MKTKYSSLALACAGLIAIGVFAYFKKYSDAICPITQLNQWAEIANNYPEFPKNIHTNWSKPNYRSFLSQTNWNTIGQFKNLITTVTLNREKKDYQSSDAIVIQTNPESRFFVFNHIEGHLHSIARSLDFLKKQKIISNSLQIIDKNASIVFMGDTIGRSAYNLETLSLILELIKKNPEHVFMLAGNYEYGFAWKDFPIQDELRIKTHSLPAHLKPMEADIINFFNTIPTTLFIAEKNNPKKVIRISSQSRESSILNEDILPDTSANKNLERVRYYQADVEKDPKKVLEVVGIIKDENRLYEDHAHQGLGRLAPDQGAVAWTVLSSPLKIYQEYLKFDYDAFVELTIKDPIEKSTLTLYSHDIQKPDDLFDIHETITFSTGLPASLNQYDPNKEIVVGSTLPLVQGIPEIGQQLKRGMSVCIDEQNKKGGIKNQFIRAVILNDNYAPSQARTNIDFLREQNITTILLPFGSTTLESYKDYIKNNDILVLFPVTGNPELRNEELQGLINLTATYADGATAIMYKLIKEYGLSRFAFFFQNDSFGISTLNAAHDLLKKEEITDWTDVSYKKGNLNLKEQALKITEAQPQAIGLFSSAYPTQELIRNIGIQKLTDTILFGIYTLGEERFRIFVQKHGLPVLFDSAVPNPWISTIEIAQEYRNAMKSHGYPLDVFSFQAYIATSLYIHTLEKIETPYTHDKIQEKLESLHDYTFKGYPLNFNPKTRSLAKNVWIEMSQDKPWQQVEITPLNSE